MTVPLLPLLPMPDDWQRALVIVARVVGAGWLGRGNQQHPIGDVDTIRSSGTSSTDPPHGEFGRQTVPGHDGSADERFRWAARRHDRGTARLERGKPRS